MGKRKAIRQSEPQGGYMSITRLPGPLTELLVVGLGNATHPFTRHSAGHLLIDSLTARFRVPLRSNGLYSSGKTTVVVGQSSANITFVKTKPLMNISGKSVVSALRAGLEHPIPCQMVLLHDSLDHKPLAVSHKFGGSANGHNGIKDVISALGGNKEFHRLRLGIGRPTDGYSVTDYVLGKMSSDERKWWHETGEGTDAVWQEIAKIIQKG